MRRSLLHRDEFEQAQPADRLNLPLPIEKESWAVNQGPHQVLARRFWIACSCEVLDRFR